MNRGDQFYSICAECDEISVHKDGWSEARRLHLDTVEISPRICCFEWEGSGEFRPGEELSIRLRLPAGLFQRRATIFWMEECTLLDEGYEMTPCFTYCARFDGEIEADFFRTLMGTPRRCNSYFQLIREGGELFSE